MAPEPATPARPARAAFARAPEFAASAAVRATAVPSKKSPARQSRYKQPVKATCSCLGPAADRIVIDTSADSDLLRDADEEAASWSELRCEHADAGAVPDLVDLVEHVHHIEPQRGRLIWRHDKEIVRYAHIDMGVGRQVISVDEARTKPAAIDHRSGKERIFPQVGSPGRCGQDLAVVGVDVVGANVGQFVRAEQELVGDDIGAELACPSNVAVHPKIAHCIERLEFEADIVRLGIVESIEDIGLAELSVIQQIARELEIAIKADFETRNRPNLLHDA